MTEERKITGIIVKWGEPKAGFKKDGITPWASIGCVVKDDSGENWHSFFGKNNAERIVFRDENPTGSVIEFTQKKKGEYWNYIDDSWKLISKGNGSVPVTQDQPPVHKDSSKEVPPGVWEAKDRRMARMNSLTHATNLILETMKMLDPMKIDELLDQSQDKVLKLAEKYEAWIYREIKPEEKQEETPRAPEEKIE